MSSQNRNITFYAINFLIDDKYVFSKKSMIQYLTFLSDTPLSEKLIKNDQTNKAIVLSDVILMEEQSLARLIFKSCKFNHSPDYMSSVDGSARPTSKRLDEGEEEKTHLSLRFEDNEAFCVFEERRTGVTIETVIDYFNHFIGEFGRKTGSANSYKFVYSTVPTDDFLTSLNNAQRVSIAELSFQKSILGSDCLNLATEDECTEMRDELVLSIKSKPREGILKRLLNKMFNSISVEGERITRIRLYAKDCNNISTIIDSKYCKKTTTIRVELAPNGTVESMSIFEKMEELLCENIP